ncbi:unnamed protein product [Closterium sp. NIES-54]
MMSRCGHGPPSILLLHSAAQSSAMFTSALKRIGAAGLHAVALDLPNSGESCRAASACADPTQATQLPSGELTMVDVANLVLQAAHALRFSPPFDIVSVGDTVKYHAGQIQGITPWCAVHARWTQIHLQWMDGACTHGC